MFQSVRTAHPILADRADWPACLVALLFVVAACIERWSGGRLGRPVDRACQCRARPPARPPRPARPPQPAFPTTLTDDEGTAVTIAAEPRTIVSLAPATTETLFALGRRRSRSRARARTSFLYPPEAGALPDVATFDSVDVEKIVAMSPDVVFAGGNFFTPPDAIAKLRSLGLTVIVLYAPTVDAVYQDIELTGQAAGRSDAGRRDGRAHALRVRRRQGGRRRPARPARLLRARCDRRHLRSRPTSRSSPR